MSGSDLRIRALDGYELPATLFEPGVPAARAVIVSPATATPRGFYRAFCEYLAEQGAVALTYEYRGTFESPGALRASRARMRDWGELDFAGAVRWMKTRYPHLALHAVGHSVGGHVLMMTPEAASIESAVGVATQSGYWRLYRGFERYRVFAFVSLIMPMLTKLFGYFPGKRVVFGTNLAPGVLYEWSRWCTSPRYFFADPLMAPVLANRSGFHGELTLVGIADDPWATPQAIDALLPGFPNARVSRIDVDPGRFGLDEVGHMGFFRARNGQLWPLAARALGLNLNEELA